MFPLTDMWAMMGGDLPASKEQIGEMVRSSAGGKSPPLPVTGVIALLGEKVEATMRKRDGIDGGEWEEWKVVGVVRGFWMERSGGESFPVLLIEDSSDGRLHFRSAGWCRVVRES